MREEAQRVRQEIAQILSPDQLQALREAHVRADAAGGRGARRTGHRAGGPFLVRALTSDAFLALLRTRGA
jgi:hypothetical protein